ncbi:MAG: hotdog fold thioesterase [Rhodothermales bacterium]|nr:hotdog fold thioesterase [Rhodothermales bacterium]
MSIWFQRPPVEQLNTMCQGNMLGHVGIAIVSIDDSGLTGTMPVDERTRQPFGILHGGASVVLAETLASMAATFTIDIAKYSAVGLEVNANHIRAIKSGFVTGRAEPIHIGKSTQVWEVRVTAEEKLASIHRITMAVLERN